MTVGGLSLFTIGVAATHTLASAFMVVMNQQLLNVDSAVLQKVFAPIDATYNLIYLPMMLGLLVGFVSLGIGIFKNQTIFSKKALFFFPLLWALILSSLGEMFEHYPIILKSAALSAVIFNTALLLFKKNEL